MANVVNPYNFVPLEHAPSRTALDAYYTGKLLTGRLDYTLTTDTPLLIPDSAKVVMDEKIDTDKMYAPSFLMVLTGTGDFAYRRKDGVYVIPIGCLKN